MKIIIQDYWRKITYLSHLSPSLKKGKIYIGVGLFLSLLIPGNLAFSQNPDLALRVVVNSNQDGEIQADEQLTLREAIALANGSLEPEQLSSTEKAQVQVSSSGKPYIEFNLPPQQTTITLVAALPPLYTPGLIIDGTTQPGYDAKTSPTAEVNIPKPVVSITPAPDAEVFRGLTVLADNITIRGLSIYGFTSKHRVTASTPPADIFIAHTFIPAHTLPIKPPEVDYPDDFPNRPPENVVIENNWLGITPEEKMPEIPSAFGVSVFNAINTTIRRNRISYHDGSGIITGIQAQGMQVLDNIIVGNGLAGMPDAIRLEGKVDKSTIRANLICGNDGSGIFLFKPAGSTNITENQIKLNGRRFRRGAVYLMGNDHQVKDNLITYQAGSGVVVTSYPQSDRNLIQNNQFSALEGLSIDLISHHNTGVQDYQNGDGPNPQRNSPNRRQDTANAGINTPQFLSPEFLSRDQTTVGIDGIAEPDAEIEIYRVSGNDGYGVLEAPIATTKTDSKGRFSFNLENFDQGERISAIATHPQYGTSEPAYPALLRSLNTPLPPPVFGIEPVQCLTPPIAQVPPETPETPPETPPQPIRLTVPKNVHFALDKDNISPNSGKVLDRIAQVLKENPSIIIELQGHTDIRASDAYNIDLAARRARSVRNYLIRRGIAPERMTIRSFGERQLRTGGTTRLDHARNRRVELIYQDIRGIEVIVQEEDLQLE
jgi:outer membrane protein OmpA-like peptidoglycan-associated protein